MSGPYRTLAERKAFLLRLDPSARTYALGIAAQPADPDYFYVG